MTPGKGLAQPVEGAAAASRADELRRALATTADPAARVRVRVRLADLLSAMGDPLSALGELRQAAAEGPASAGLLFGMQVVGSRLPASQTDALRVAIKGARPTTSAPLGTGRRPDEAATGRSAPSTAGRVSEATPMRMLMRIPMAPMPAASREALKPSDPVDLAFHALAEGKTVRARRFGEEAARLGDGLGTGAARRTERLRELVVGLDRAGARRESLYLARTLVEDGHEANPSAERSHGLRAIVDLAAGAGGQPDLAARWSADLAPPLVRPVSQEGPTPATAPSSAAARFRAVQGRALVAAVEGTNSAALIADLIPLLGDHKTSAAALALAERLSDEAADRAPVPRTELLRLAFAAERSPRPRQKLALRWADALTASGDSAGALVVIDHAIEVLPEGASRELRAMRVQLLRILGREDELCRAIESDALLVAGRARAELRAEQARLLDRLGKSDHALEVRLAALEDAPGDLGLLAPARQQLEGMGRLDRSLDLARAALPHLKDRGARAGLLRDIATLAEVAAADRPDAARAWLDVLSLVPEDVVAREAAERLLRQMGERDRLEALLACSAAREAQPAARARLLWRLAEFHRSERRMPFVALGFYREIVGSAGGGGAGSAGLTFTDDDWQRRDDLLAVHTARCLAAPTPAEAAQAIADRAVLLTDAGRLDDADRELGRALDLDSTIDDVFRELERLHERRGDPSGLRQRLMARVEGATGAAAAHLWFAIGRAHETLGELPAAGIAYEHACAADVGFRLPATRLRELALARGDFAEAARLLEREIALTSNPSERVALSVELSVLLATKLNAGARAVEVLDAVAGSTPDHPGALEAMFGAALAAGAWEKATQALEGMLTAGLTPADTSERYHQLGLAAEKAGQLDRALGLYSRSYARNSAFRPTLERLSEICFERQQWDNAWKATEHLLERHGADLDGNTRAELALRSALADLHVGQRMVAATRISTMLPGPVSTSGLRDVAESWGSMRFEPHLLGKVDGDRRARVLARLAEVLALTNRNPGHMALSIARETLAALAIVDRRWADALSLLDALGGDSTLDARRRSLFLACAGDLLSRQQGDAAGAALRYERARALNPNEPRLARVGEAGRRQGGSAGSGVVRADTEASHEAGTQASDPRNRPPR